MPKKKKIPKANSIPNPPKKPAIGSQLLSDDGGQVYWSFALIDCDGRWGFKEICKEEFYNLITSEFKSKEGINWNQLKSSGSHNIETDKLDRAAQKRLIELQLDDLDQLFSLRITGRKRVWGIRDGNIFKVIWWDPNHEICYSAKKHT